MAPGVRRLKKKRSDAPASVLLCVVVVAVCALFGADLQRLLRRIARRGPLREGQTPQPLGTGHECSLNSECKSHHCKGVEFESKSSADVDAASADAASAEMYYTVQTMGTCQPKDADAPLKMEYYLELEDRDSARVDNMTSKQAYDDLNTSYSLQLAHIGIMFFFTLCVLFTLLNLDAFEGLFGSGAPGRVVDTTVYAAKKAAK
tara:strand:- start:183 stop:794 length:612 start_codon:yes stop_codon:yes gene_type:complete